MNIVLTSKSKIKVAAVRDLYKVENLTCVSTSQCGNPEQPVGIENGLICCKRRIEWYFENFQVPDNTDLIISIENGITAREQFQDLVHILVYTVDDGIYYYRCGGAVTFDRRYYELALEGSKPHENGMSVTIGEIMHLEHRYPKDNWMLGYAELDRKDQICKAFAEGEHNLRWARCNILRGNVDYIPNFPKKGIVFKSLKSILANPTLFNMLCNESVKTIRHEFEVKSGDFGQESENVDYIVALDARGFILGAVIAKELNAGLVLVRKKGKLAGPVVSADYTKEYGVDTFELSKNTIKKGSRVVIVDDLLATGGSLRCAVDLISQLDNVTVAGCFAVLQVNSLYLQAKQTLQGCKMVTLLP
jgi:adenine phosphoribosyltransferase